MSKLVKIGNVSIGGGSSVKIQSMSTKSPSQIEESILELERLENAGCDIIRFSVLNEDDCKAIKILKGHTRMPIVADIHFDYKLALRAIEMGANKIRINPGNIGEKWKVEEVAKALKQNNVPVRVGSNTGSIEKEFLDKYGKNEVSLGESALKHVKVLEDMGVEDIVISVKASSVPLMVKAYEYINAKTNYPLHLGVTEAGSLNYGVVKNSIGIGSLLLKGIGDTIRVSLSTDPIEEVYSAKRILRSLELDTNYVEVVSCPTCGRCAWDMFSLLQKVENYVQNIQVPLKLAIMGCVVNGPGEAKDAHLGIAGGKDGCVIFKNGNVYRRIAKDEVEKEFFKELDECVKQAKQSLL